MYASAEYCHQLVTGLKLVKASSICGLFKRFEQAGVNAAFNLFIIIIVSNHGSKISCNLRSHVACIFVCMLAAGRQRICEYFMPPSFVGWFFIEASLFKFKQYFVPTELPFFQQLEVQIRIITWNQAILF